MQAGRHSIRRGLPICPALAPSPCPSVGLGTSTRAGREPSSTIKSSCPAAHAPCTPDTSHARRVQLLSCSGLPARVGRRASFVVASCSRPSTSREEWQRGDPRIPVAVQCPRRESQPPQPQTTSRPPATVRSLWLLPSALCCDCAVQLSFRIRQSTTFFGPFFSF